MWQKRKPHKASTAAWRVIGDRRLYFRSLWEANFARYLQYLKENGHIREWDHEPTTFWFDGIRRGCVSYLPDFQQINNDGTSEWIEVKGYYDARSKTKIKRFAKYFPDEKLRVIDSKWFRENNQKMFLLIPGWEKGSRG